MSGLTALEAIREIGPFSIGTLGDGTEMKLFMGEVDNGYIASYWIVKDGKKKDFVISANGKTEKEAKENLRRKILSL